MKLELKYQQFIPYGILILLFLVLEVGFGFNGLYGQDSHEYLRFARDWKTELMTGVQSDQDFFWPKAYPITGALLSWTGLSVLWSLRLISLLGMVGMLYFTQRIVALLYNRSGVLFLVLGAVTQVYFVRMGILVMSDALCGFLVLGVFYHYLKYVIKNHRPSFLWMLVFAIAAFFARYASAPLILVPVVHGCYSLVRKWSLLWQLLITLGLAAVVILFTFWNNHMVGQLIEVGREWDVKTLFSRSYYRHGKHEFNWVPNIVYIFSNFFHVGFLAIGICLVPFYRKLKLNTIVIVSVGIYLLFIGGLSIQNHRFMVLTHPLVLVLLFPAFKGLMDWLTEKRLNILFVIGVLSFNGFFFWYSFRKTYAVHRTEIEVVEAIRRLDNNSAVYGFYVDQSFKSYNLKNETRNLFLHRYDHFEEGALVVFNEQLFAQEWEENNVMLNWTAMNEAHELEIIESLPQNWTIYRIK